MKEIIDPVSISMGSSQGSSGAFATNNETAKEHNGEYAGLHLQIKQLQKQLQKEREEKEELEKENEKLKKSVMIDALTKAYNRLFLEKVAGPTVATEMRKKRSWATLFLDIDHFGDVNKEHGHPVGDEVLKNVVKTMQYIARKGDFVIRCGGEEFLILLFNIEEGDVQNLAERFRKAVKDTVTDINGKELRVTVSIGACFVPEDGQTNLESVIIHANNAMRTAKVKGRDQVIFCPEQRKSSKSRKNCHRRKSDRVS